MLYKSILLTMLLLFSACGGGSGKTTNIENKNFLVDLSNDTNNISQKQNDNFRYVTIYVHGYDKNGHKLKDSVYGKINNDEVIDNLVEITNFATMDNFTQTDKNILAIAPYYGDTPPSYYTQQDIEDIDKITKEYGGGIPRYATIIAKFAKYIQKQTKADRVNIVSASMGSLVTRWIIEKDVEHLASEKKISKWLSIEGVIRGNYVASNRFLLSFASAIDANGIDTKQMNYDWVNKNLSADEATSINYKDIQMGFISSTYDKEGMLSIVNSSPNDGVQLLKDTIFSKTPNNNPTYTRYFVDHIGIKKDKGAWAEVATFLSSSKRVKITLLSADIATIPSKTNIVFENSVKSTKVLETFSVNDDISERLAKGKALDKVSFARANESKDVNQVIFNDFVLDDETSLDIKITPYLDSKNPLSTIEQSIKLENGNIELSGKDWSGTIKIEVF